MRFTKTALAAASLLSCTIAGAATYTWNGQQSGYSVQVINGVPTVVKNGVPVTGAGIPTTGTPPAGNENSGTWDATTTNWLNGATATALNAQSTDTLNFGEGTAGVPNVVRVASNANLTGAWNFTSSYSVLKDNNATLSFNSVTVAANAGVVRLYNATGPTATVGAGSTLVFDNSTSSTMGSGGLSSVSGAWFGAGDIVKNGSGVVQYTGQAALYGSGSLVNGATYNALAGRYVNNTINGAPGANFLANVNALAGYLTVNQGILQVSGYINQWVEYDPNLLAAPVTHWDGVAAVVLNGSAELNFTNTALNVATGRSALVGGSGDTTLTKRYNFVQNLTAGALTDASGVLIKDGSGNIQATNNQNQTSLYTGIDNSYRIVVNIGARDATDVAAGQLVQGSIGILSGFGDVIKTGVGNLTILNSATAGFGRLQISNGTVTLSSQNGLSLANAISVNLAGTDSARGYGVSMIPVSNLPGSVGVAYWAQGIAPTPGQGTLVVGGSGRSELIHNLQADFAYDSSGIDLAPKNADGTAGTATVATAVAAAAIAHGDEALIAGTGMGSRILLGDNTLTIQQDRDGVYRGSIYGAYTFDSSTGTYTALTTGTPTGTIIKTGTAKLVLIPDDSYFGAIIVRQGTLVTNAQALGQSTVTINSGGQFKLLQINTGTLQATLVGSGQLVIGTSEFVDNGSGTPIQVNSQGTAGFLQIAKKQDQFTGSVLALDGITIDLNSPVEDVLSAASSVTLSAGTTGKQTTLALGTSVQHLQNLNGDAQSRLSLGRSILFLAQSSSGSFAGDIIGVGSLAKTGSGSYVLDGTKTKYFGATVVGGGALGVVGANGLSRSSGLVLNNGGAFVSNNTDQSFGALFGTSGTVVSMGAGTLTIGTSATRASLLLQELNGGKPLSADYLGTSTTALDLNNAAIGSFDTALVGTATSVADATRLFLQKVGFTNTEAASLAFAGNIVGSGGLVKIGLETLTLSGVNQYTGATSVQGGVLQVNWNSINASSGVTIATSARLAVNADASSGDGAFTRAVSGGIGSTLAKVGTGTVTVAGSQLSGFTGTLSAENGVLELAESGPFSGSAVVTSTGTLRLNQTANATAAFTVVNSGVLEKTGSGLLAIGAYSGTGAVKVSSGTLAVSGALPTSLDVAAGAVFQDTITGTLTASNPVTGAGTVRIIGSGSGATLLAGVDNLFPTVTLDLRSVVFRLNPPSGTQTLGGFMGDANSSIDLNNGMLVLAPAVAGTFDGTVTGNGGITKNGAGTLTLTSTINTGWTGTTTVNAGELEATPDSLGNSSVTVNTNGTLALRNTDTANTVPYTNAVTGLGKLAKTGAGEIYVGSIGVAGGVQVREGRLTVTDGGTDAVFTNVDISAAGTFQVDMTSDRIHDSSSSAKVTGAGSLAVSGAHTLTLTNSPQSYTGNTELLNGATLAFGAGLNTLNGLAGDATSTVIMPGDLTITQTVNGVFSGNFAGTAGALTVAGTGLFGIAGDLSSQAGLTSVTVSGGHLQVAGLNSKAIVNNGTVDIFEASSGASRYTGAITGTGAVNKTGDGKVSFGDGVTTGIEGNPYVLQSTGTLTVSGGVLGGVFTTSGNLVVAGGTLAPGNSPGTVTVNGNFNLASNGTLAVEVNASTSDKVVVNGAATIAGALKVTQDATPGSAAPAGGQKFTILTATGGVTGNFSNASSTGIIQLDQTDPAQAATGYKRVHVDNTGSALVMTGITGLRDVSGFQQHDGVGSLVGVLDAGLAPAAVQAVANNAWGASTTALVNNFSPLVLGAEYAMAQDGENRRQAQLHDRMEQRRYDRGSPLTAEDAPWEAFLTGQSSFVNSKSDSDTATFDYKTYGGLAGLDRKLNDGTVVGAALGYDNGTATAHDGGGKIEMDRFAATAFFSGQLTSRWYLDLGATGGVGLYDVKRNTALGGLKGENTGYSGGFYGETGTLVVLAKDLHLTPYVGLAYTHHEFDGFTEKGNAAALNVSAWSQDSLRARIGTGLNYFMPFESWKLRFGLDVNYAQELLDTDSDIDARFTAGGPRFGTTANALPDGAIGITPSLGVQITEYVSASVGYTYEVGLDARSYQSLNFALRTRF